MFYMRQELTCFELVLNLYQIFLLVTHKIYQKVL